VSLLSSIGLVSAFAQKCVRTHSSFLTPTLSQHTRLCTPPTARHTQPTSCQVCGAFTRQPMITPCAHVVCLDCTAMHRTRCPLPVCAAPYTMQAVDDPARRAHNPNPKWTVGGGGGWWWALGVAGLPVFLGGGSVVVRDTAVCCESIASSLLLTLLMHPRHLIQSINPTQTIKTHNLQNCTSTKHQTVHK